jgi:hypothetical protein
MKGHPVSGVQTDGDFSFIFFNLLARRKGPMSEDGKIIGTGLGVVIGGSLGAAAGKSVGLAAAGTAISGVLPLAAAGTVMLGGILYIVGDNDKEISQFASDVVSGTLEVASDAAEEIHVAASDVRDCAEKVLDELEYLASDTARATEGAVLDALDWLFA